MPVSQAEVATVATALTDLSTNLLWDHTELADAGFSPELLTELVSVVSKLKSAAATARMN